MEDLSAKLTQLLAQPDAAEKLSQAAQALLGGPLPQGAASPPQGSVPGAEDMDPAALLSAISALRSADTDARAALLLALRPHLSSGRQQRVDTALKLLKLVQLLPLLRAQGLLNL